MCDPDDDIEEGEINILEHLKDTKYAIDKKWEPLDRSPDQQCWVGTISCTGEDDHENVIEVRAATKGLLDVRLNLIMKTITFADGLLSN